MLNAIIIDDELQARLALRHELEVSCPQVNILAEADSVKSGITVLLKYKPNLVLLDIRLTDGNGFDILKKVSQLDFKVIFTTAYSEYALQAIKFSALDYLLKPVDGQELKDAIEKVKAYDREDYNMQMDNFIKNRVLKNPEKRIALNTSDGIFLYELQDIIRCTSDGNYTCVHSTNGNKLLIAKTLKEFEKLLTHYNFQRVHKSHIINIDHVVSYLNKGSGYLVMSDGSEVLVAQRKKTQLLSILNTFKANFPPER